MEKSKLISAVRKCSLLLLVAFLVACQSDTGQENTSDTFRMRENTGIDFRNTIEEKYDTFFEFFSYVYNGGGVAAGDINNDGLVDLYFTGNEVQDRLYLNEGDFEFKDISTSAGIDQHRGWCNGVTMSDVNQDGWLDIYISRGGWKDSPSLRANLLYINNQDGTFTERAAEFGLNDTGHSNHSVFFDMDNDNDLDMYLVNRPEVFNIPLSQMYERSLNPPDYSRDKLFMNDGTNHFKEVSLERGIKNYGYSLGVVAGDVNHDGWTDIFVANDYSTPDHLYINRGDGYFEDMIDSAMNHSSLYSMGVDLADFNNDQMEDFIVMEMRPTDYVRSKVSMPSMDVQGFRAIVDAGMHKQYMHNMVHMNQGKLHFSEVSQLVGLAKTDWSWSVLFQDMDNDGKRDVFITNGMRRDSFDGDSKGRLTKYIQENKHKYQTPDDLFGEEFSNIIDVFNAIKLPNYLYLNQGNYAFRQEESAAFAQESFSNGAVVADLDNDGDLDIVTNNIEDRAFVLENTRPVRNWLKVSLDGPGNNRFGLDAKVYVYSGLGVQYFQQKTTRGYLSSQDPVIHFGLDSIRQVDSVVVVWPDKRRNVQYHVPSNTRLSVDYQRAAPGPKGSPRKTFFSEVTKQVLKEGFVHQDNEVDEYREQVLLPHEFSKNGPKLAKADLNGDGLEDFYMGGSRGNPGTLFFSTPNGWKKQAMPAFQSDLQYEDADAVFFDFDGDGDQDLFVASGGSDLPSGDPLYQNRLYRNNRGAFIRVNFPGAAYNSSAVLAADFDRDGDLDLFVGGFVQTNRYPHADKSSFFRNDRGTFVEVTDTWLPNPELGIVYDATLADLDTDGQEELVIVGEWMPVTVLSYADGRIRDITATFGLTQTVGWWNAIHAADLDGDGDADLVGGNLGENYKFQVDGTNEFKVYASDFDQNGTFDVFLANQKDNKLLPVRGRECSSQQMPLIKAKYPSYNEFAKAELDEILGDGIKTATQYQVDVLSSVLLRNDGGVFTPVELPREAQFSTINSIVTEDLNGDGLEDLLIGGNRFNSEVETTPSDASLGLLMWNKGVMQFEAVPATHSGLYLSGNVKDLHLLNGKGSTFLLSTENQGPIRVLKLTKN